MLNEKEREREQENRTIE
jgi:hypothetical protein